ncbi:MAG: bifunctional folylpolyglutamate synthase/dihydrofolate synthase, partial [Clostridia bacterium]|nr:bifunctional folylpolyglutamate synthase/dihydrofolate synthase [Clostridia bacterium]
MKDFEKYAHSFQVFPRLGLERITHLLACLGDPQKDCGRVLHIAGTNGKGSVAVALASVLTAAGFRVGLYTSPNLVRVNERVVLDGAPISDADLSRLISEVEKAARETEAALGEMPTPFEIWTATAFLYFCRQRCDYVVLEVGLGGAFDATNVVGTCEMALLAHIDLDHTAQLGSTVAAVARAKCGIIKDGCRVFSVPQYPDAEAVIRETCREKRASLTFCHPPAPGRREGFFEVADMPLVGLCRLPFAGIHQLA